VEYASSNCLSEETRSI